MLVAEDCGCCPKKTSVQVITLNSSTVGKEDQNSHKILLKSSELSCGAVSDIQYQGCCERLWFGSVCRWCGGRVLEEIIVTAFYKLIHYICQKCGRSRTKKVRRK